VASAVRNFGLDPARLSDARLSDESIGYLEFHIEQGPLLESIGRRLAVVETIAGQSRLTFRFTGHSNHAGTTPMHLRRDALAGAAEWIGFVEAYAGGTAGLVATVGRIEAKPGAANVIPGDVHASLDVRHAQDEVRSTSVRVLITKAEEIAYARGLRVEQELLLQQAAVPMDENLIAIAQRAIAACGLDGHRMTSGAGHDAMIIAEKIPSVMIFLRSPGGISHHPDETVLLDDVELALEAGEQFLAELADIEHA
jgi:allantoate deiminase